jgi:hypothetical protein
MHDVLDNLKRFLHPYEQIEILNYTTIYFLPILERKLPGGMETMTGNKNNGFDNDVGEYTIKLRDHMAY